MRALAKKALQDPTKLYERPSDVVNDARLSFEEKSAILQAWENLARDLAVATEEGMTGGEPSRLTEVAEARVLLGSVSREDLVSAPTKRGNKIL